MHHPAFQSLVLPLLLALLGMAALRAWRGEHWALWGAVVGLLGALAWLPGFQWPADARHLKVPWIVAAGLGVAVLLQAVWRGRDAAPAEIAVWAFVTVAAALGLAGLAAVGGSLLLAQLALMLATTAAAACGWACWRPAAATAAARGVFLAFGVAWLSLAWCWVLGAPPPAETHAVRVAILALVFVVPVLLARLRSVASARRLRLPWAQALPVLLAVLLALLLAALPVALAVVWPGATTVKRMPDTAVELDDPYLTPSWR